jgi:hypothetical protein
MAKDKNELETLISILDSNLPIKITLDSIISESFDLGEELDQFDGEVKEYLDVDELDSSTIDAAKTKISTIINDIRLEQAFERQDLLIYLLEDLSEKLDNLY